MSFPLPRATSHLVTRNLFRASRHRPASTSAHTEHEGYSREDFSNPIWRNTVIATLFAVAAYKYAPEPGDNAYLTRWIELYKTPRETWFEINARHTARQQEVSADNILLSDAKKEARHCYRYPQILEQSSPFLNGVGM